MAKQKKPEPREFWKTVLIVTIVTEKMPSPNMSLSDFDHLMTEGDGMGMTDGKFTRISPKQAAKLCLKMEGDPEFFGIDAEGKDVDKDG